MNFKTLFLFIFVTSPLFSYTYESKVKIKIVIIDEQGDIKEQVYNQLENRFKKIKNVVVDNDKPFSTLYLYFSKTVGSEKNKSGYAISIAHTTSYIQKFIQNEFEKTSPNDIQRKLIAILANKEELKYISVIHMDKFSDFIEKGVLESIVNTFEQKEINRLKNGFKIE